MCDTESTSDLICPFCREGDFDEQGLAYHLHAHCGAYQTAIADHWKSLKQHDDE